MSPKILIPAIIALLLCNACSKPESDESSGDVSQSQSTNAAGPREASALTPYERVKKIAFEGPVRQLDFRNGQFDFSRLPKADTVWLQKFLSIPEIKSLDDEPCTHCQLETYYYGWQDTTAFKRLIVAIQLSFPEGRQYKMYALDLNEQGELLSHLKVAEYWKSAECTNNSYSIWTGDQVQQYTLLRCPTFNEDTDQPGAGIDSLYQEYEYKNGQYRLVHQNNQRRIVTVR